MINITLKDLKDKDNNCLWVNDWFLVEEKETEEKKIAHVFCDAGSALHSEGIILLFTQGHQRVDYIFFSEFKSQYKILRKLKPGELEISLTVF